MKSATVKELKTELSNHSHEDLVKYCLRLSRFKKENKELLNYLLFESHNEMLYVESVKNEIEEQFKNVNKTSFYYIKKSVRKILRTAKKFIRYSDKKESEVEILLHFCQELKKFRPSYSENKVLTNIFTRQIECIKNAAKKLHEDLQFDYQEEIKQLLDS